MNKERPTYTQTQKDEVQSELYSHPHCKQWRYKHVLLWQRVAHVMITSLLRNVTVIRLFIHLVINFGAETKEKWPVK